MKSITGVSYLLIMLSLCVFLSGLHAQVPPKILVFSKTAGYRHKSIEHGVKVLQQLGEEHGITVDHTEDAAWFTGKRLAAYKAIVFLSTSGDVFNRMQEKAFRTYIKSGGGFVGIHAASTTEYHWPWYRKLVGAYFDGHPKVQPAIIDRCDNEHPSTKFLPEHWRHTDEWYNFRKRNTRVHVLLKVDEDSYQGGKHGDDHPIAWYHDYKGGRAFYTALGHSDEAFDEVLLQKHLWGGIVYAMGEQRSQE